MSDKAKVILAVTVVVLMIAVIVLVNITKNKENSPGTVPVEATATPTAPEPTSVPTDVPTAQPTPVEEIPTATPIEEVQPIELTEEQKLTIKLLQDPYNLEGETPLESVTVTGHSEQTANLDRNNMFMLDVSAELDEKGVDYIPLSVTYDMEGEYLKNGYRVWSGFVSDKKSSNGGSAAIYDFSKGTVHTYDYISNYGRYEDKGTANTKVTEEKYKPWPKYNFYDMFSENLPPELKETDTEYIIEGLTTTNGYIHNSETDLFTVTTNPDNGFQYLIRLTIHYDKETQRIKYFDAKVEGKIVQEIYGVSNDPTAEKVESDIGLVTSTLHVEFSKYNETVLTKLDGKVYVDVDKYTDKTKGKETIPVYTYTFADGTKYYFTVTEWVEKVQNFIDEPNGGGGYNDFIGEIDSIENDFTNKCVVLKDIPPEKREDAYKNDDEWNSMIERMSGSYSMNPVSYEVSQITGFYYAPPIPYLCELLLDKEGKVKEQYSDDTYTGKEYANLISVAYIYYKDMLGTGMMPISKLKDSLRFNFDNISDIWEYEPIQYSEIMSNAEQGNSLLKKAHLQAILNLVRDDMRNKFETVFKAWIEKNHVGSTTNPNS